MKAFTRTLVLAAALAIPALSFAQANSADNAPAAQAQVAQQSATAPGANGAADGSAAGTGHHPFAFLHRLGNHTQSGNDCVGPVSYCTPYFGS